MPLSSVESVLTSVFMCMYCTLGPTEELKVQMPSEGKSNEALCLTLPGNELDLSALLKDKKFRGRGNKEGALQAMRILEEDELGKLEEKQTKGSVKVHIDNTVWQIFWVGCSYQPVYLSSVYTHCYPGLQNIHVL